MGRRMAVMVAGMAMLASGAAPAAAQGPGTPKPRGCLAYKGPPAPAAGCAMGRAMFAPTTPVVTSDGEHAYAHSVIGLSAPAPLGAILVFDRDPITGVLRQKAGSDGCLSPESGDGCTVDDWVSSTGLLSAVALSPDDEFLYATSGSHNAIVTYGISGDGSLNRVHCLSSDPGPAGCATTGRRLDSGTHLAVNPDDGTVYMSSYSGGALTAFTPQPNGELAQKTGGAGCVVQSGSVPNCDTDALLSGGLASVTVAPDGNFLYVVSGQGAGGAIGVYERDLDRVSCRSQNGTLGCPTDPALDRPWAAATSPRGPSLYVVVGGRDALLTYRRNAATGALTPLAGGCLARLPAPDCARTAAGIDHPRGVAVGGNGAQVYVAAASSGSLLTFDTAADGAPTQKPLPLGCLAASLAGCLPGPGLNAASFVTVSPDDRHVYVTGQTNPPLPSANALTSFARDRVPSCQGTAAQTNSNTAVAVQLRCTDPDGDPLAYQVLGAPARGVLGAVQPNGQVLYGPIPGSSGVDSFAYRAIAAGVASAPATATIDVAFAAPPAPPAPLPAPSPPPARVLSDISSGFANYRRYTIFTRLRVTEVPAGGRVELRCRAKRKRDCPFARRRVPVRRGRANALRPLHRKRIKAGTVIELRITDAGAIGKVVRYTVRPPRFPKRQTLCLPVGSTRPQRRC